MGCDEPSHDPIAAERVGLLLSRDLIFISKVTGTARALGCRILVTGTAALVAEMIDKWHPKVLFVDLSAGDLVGEPALVAYRELAGPGTSLIAFGSHVDTAALEAAKAAGCDLVLPRSRFSAELPALIRSVLEGADGMSHEPGPGTS